MAMKFVLTNKGLELKAKIEAGAVLNFTKAETGDIYSPIPLELQSVPNARQILDIDSIIVNDDTATVKIILSNLENTEEYYIKQLGLYASDPDTGDEILYIIGQDNIGERVPAITDIQVEYEFNVNIKAGNAASIRFEVNGEAFLRKKQFQAFLEDEFYPHINDKEIHHKHENKKLLDTITNIFSEASTLTALKSGDTLPVLLSKTAKAISTLISHIVLTGTASVLGHVKLSDTYATKIASGAAANGLGASQNALYNAYNKLNTDLGNIYTDDNSCEIIFGIYAQNGTNYYATGIFCPLNAKIQFTEAFIEGTYENLKSSMKYIKNGCHARIFSTNSNVAGKMVMIRWKYIYI